MEWKMCLFCLHNNMAIALVALWLDQSQGFQTATKILFETKQQKNGNEKKEKAMFAQRQHTHTQPKMKSIRKWK